MSESKHTAGAIIGPDGLPSGCSNPECACIPYDGGPLASARMPWTLEVCDDGWPMVHNGGDVICVPDPNHHAGCSWDVARFRLIAAAPDLLEALLTFIEVGDCKASRDEAATAITKATGETA